MIFLNEIYPNYYSPRLTLAKIYINKNKLNEAWDMLNKIKNELEHKDKLTYYLIFRDTNSLLKLFRV